MVPKLAIVVGLLLIAAGLMGYLGAGRESVTALIPAVLGLILGGLGALALWRPGARKHAMHAAAAVALLGLLGSIQGIPDVIVLAGGEEVDRPWAAVVQTITVLLTAVFLIAAVRSFIIARRERVRG